MIQQDPIYDDTVYVYHAFGVHMIDTGTLLSALTAALKEEDESKLAEGIEKAGKASVFALLNTFNAKQK